MPSYLLQVLTTRPLPANEVLSLKSRCPLHSAGLRPNVKLWPNSPLIKLDRASVPSLNKLNFGQFFCFELSGHWPLDPAPLPDCAIVRMLQPFVHSTSYQGPFCFVLTRLILCSYRPWRPFVLPWWFYITSEPDLLLNITLVHQIINFDSVKASCMIHHTPLFFYFHFARLPRP